MLNCPQYPQKPTPSPRHLRSAIPVAALACVALFTISKALPNAAHMSAAFADVAHVYALEGLK